MSDKVIIDRTSILQAPWLHMPEGAGVRRRVLWEQEGGKSYAGMIRLDPGGHLPSHVHHEGAHHVWVVDGVCSINDDVLGTLSYCYVPPGLAHDLHEVGLEGATLFYLYIAREN